MDAIWTMTLAGGEKMYNTNAEINDLPYDYNRENLILVATSGGFHRETEKNYKKRFVTFRTVR